MLKDPIVIESTAMRAIFCRSNNRWSHRFELLCNHDWTAVLESVEGTADEVWPPSPAIQELHPQANNQGHCVALGVGMSGSTHWSLSCMPCPNAQIDGPAIAGLRFELACRVKEVFQRIGNQYRVAPRMKISVAQREIKAQNGEIGFRIQAHGVDAVSARNRRIRLELFNPANREQESDPRTWQWSYEIHRLGQAV